MNLHSAYHKVMGPNILEEFTNAVPIWVWFPVMVILMAGVIAGWAYEIGRKR